MISKYFIVVKSGDIHILTEKKGDNMQSQQQKKIVVNSPQNNIENMRFESILLTKNEYECPATYSK